MFVHSSALKEADIRFLNENDVVEFDDEVRNGKLSVTTLKLIQRDEESAKKFQERRSSFHGNDREGGFGGRPSRGPREGGFSGNRGPRRDDGDKKPGWKFWGGAK